LVINATKYIAMFGINCDISSKWYLLSSLSTLVLDFRMQSFFLKSLAIALLCQITHGQVTPETFASTSFDIIIIGGGTAGLTLANRLSSTSAKVGVIDAGHYNTSGDPLLDVPFNPGAFIGDPTQTFIGNPAYDWGFASVPQSKLDGRSIPYPRCVSYFPLV